MNASNARLGTKWILVVFLFLYQLSTVFSDDLEWTTLPEIQNLTRGDVLFDQVIQSVRLYQVALAGNKPLPPLLFLKYRVKEGETLFSISAKLSLPNASIASLNRMANPALRPGDSLVIPSLPGLYLPSTAKNALETKVQERTNTLEKETFIARRNNTPETWFYVKGQDFSPAERLLFLGKFLTPPLTQYRISSRFGNRVSPLTGTLLFHNAVDLVAPIGTPVMAIADGTVRSTGFDQVYGNYVVLDHASGYRSFYAHLQSIRVRKDAVVSSGTTIGLLGNSGRSTGAHLHLELYKDGVVVNPELHIDLSP